MSQLQSSQRMVVVVEAIARVQLLFGVRNKASLIEDVVSCVCVVEDGRKSWDPKLGKLAMTPVAGW